MNSFVDMFLNSPAIKEKIRDKIDRISKEIEAEFQNLAENLEEEIIECGAISLTKGGHYYLLLLADRDQLNYSKDQIFKGLLKIFTTLDLKTVEVHTSCKSIKGELNSDYILRINRYFTNVSKLII